MMHLRRYILALLVMAIASCGGATPAGSESEVAPPDATNPPGEVARPVRIFDGDSMEMDVAGTIVEVRMIGINAPEGDECHGDTARDALIAVLGDGPVVLESGSEDRDRFGRLLRYVWIDGMEINQQMLALGHAVALSDGHGREARYRAVAVGAMEGRIGMWAPGSCGPTQAAAIEIPVLEFDPPGRDEDNALREYVDIRNVGDDPLDLEGWTLRDESTQHRYTFDDVVLAPDSFVRVRSGCGEDRGLDLVWCADDPVWSNGGDTVILQDEYGNVVAWKTYEGAY